MTRAIPARHRPIKVELPKGSTFVCSSCLVIWPCRVAHVQVILDQAKKRVKA